MRSVRAQGIAEYGLIILFIVIVASAALVLFGEDISDFINGVGDSFDCSNPGKIGSGKTGC